MIEEDVVNKEGEEQILRVPLSIEERMVAALDQLYCKDCRSKVDNPTYLVILDANKLIESINDLET